MEPAFGVEGFGAAVAVWGAAVGICRLGVALEVRLGANLGDGLAARFGERC